MNVDSFTLAFEGGWPKGRVTPARLDEAVRRVLNVKEALGLFDDPSCSLEPHRELIAIRTPAALTLARKVAVRSIVSLKNERDVLPLDGRARVALIGPLGDDPANMTVLGRLGPALANRSRSPKGPGKRSEHPADPG